MNTGETKQEFVCDCGKAFETQKALSHHKTRCKIFQANKKQRKKAEKDAKRLPNGMFICENPDCKKEHDGSYGSGRFCCKKCKNHYIAITGAQTSIKNGNKHAPKNFKVQPAPYGTWKCVECNLLFRTRAELYEHNHVVHTEQHKQSCAWNKGLTKETSVSIAIASKKVSKGLHRAYEEGRLTGKCKDPQKETERRNKISQTAKKNGKSGGKREGTGRGQQGWYKGYYCDSSWELAVIIYWLDHNIPFERCHDYFEYEFEGSIHKYYPDFIHPDGTLTEVKGAEQTLQWQAKLAQFPQNRILHVIGKNQIQPYLKYVVSTYGNNFVELYEKKRI